MFLFPLPLTSVPPSVSFLLIRRPLTLLIFPPPYYSFLSFLCIYPPSSRPYLSSPLPTLTLSPRLLPLTSLPPTSYYRFFHQQPLVLPSLPSVLLPSFSSSSHSSGYYSSALAFCSFPGSLSGELMGVLSSSLLLYYRLFALFSRLLRLECAGRLER